MFLHLGQDVIVRKSEILGIFDLDNTSVSKHTRRYLEAMEKRGKVFNVSYELPKSFVVVLRGNETVVYISQISPSTLAKRNKHKENINF